MTWIVNIGLWLLGLIFRRPNAQAAAVAQTAHDEQAGAIAETAATSASAATTEAAVAQAEVGAPKTRDATLARFMDGTA